MSEIKKRKLDDNLEDSTNKRFEILEEIVKQQSTTIKGLEELVRQQNETIKGLRKDVNGLTSDFASADNDQDHQDEHFDLELLFTNPAYHGVTKTIISYLNLNTMVVCCLVSQSFRDSVVNHRHWWAMQLNFMKRQPKPCTARKSSMLENFDFSGHRRLLELFPWYSKVFDSIQSITSNGEHLNITWCMRRYWNKTTMENKAFTLFLYTIRSRIVDFAEYLMRIFDSEDYKKEEDNARKVYNTTPFALACSSGGPSILSLMLNSISEKEIDTNFGFPLHKACQLGSIENVKLLFERRQEIALDFNQVNEEGKTALEVAKMNNYEEIVNVFQSHGFDE